VKLEDEQQKFNWRSIFNDKTEVKSTRRLVLCFMIQFFQQFTGINVIAFYGINLPLY
jgi:Sugar (and other) transporter